VTGNNQGALNTELLDHLCVLDQLGIIRRCDRDWPVPNERLTRILGRASEGNTPESLSRETEYRTSASAVLGA
jgi:hypothetical protein